MLRNILGPVFNLYLDQFLTYNFFFAETPIFIVFQQKIQNLKKHKKRKNTLFVNTIVLTALVQVSFFLHFSFLLFFSISVFLKDVFVWFPKIKKYKKKQSKQNKKQEQKEDKRCKAKQMKDYDSKQSKTTSRTTETKEQRK